MTTTVKDNELHLPTCSRILFLVEDAGDVERALDHIRETGRDPKHCLLLNFNSGFTVNRSQTGDIPVRSEDEYLKYLDLELLNHIAVKDARSWLEHPEVRDLLTHAGVFLGLVVESSWVRSITTLYKYVELLTVILRQEQPKEIIVFSEDPPRRETELTFGERDKIAHKIIAAAPAISCPTTILRYTPKRQHIRLSLRSFLDRLARTASRYMRQTLNLLLQATAKPEESSIVVTGAPRIMFPILDALNHKIPHQLIYFQFQTSPRILFSLFRRRIPYLSCERPAAPSHRRDDLTDLREFLKIAQRNVFFHYKSFNLTKAMEPKLFFLFTEKFPALRMLTNALQKHLRRCRCRLILADEATWELNRCLMLVARAMNITTAEFQHGTITKYFLEHDVVDAKLVWGKYFKEKIIEQLHLSPDRIAVVGPLHYESIFGEIGPDKVLTKRKTLIENAGIPSSSRIVLFAPHPFDRGSRGGVLGRHLTRAEAHEMLEEVVSAIRDAENIFLVVKLHNGEAYTKFYERYLETNLPLKNFHIVQKGVMYDLLLAADIVIAPSSTVILESVLCDKPVILLNLRNKKLLFPYADWNATPTITVPGSLAAELNEYLTDARERLLFFQEGRQRLKREFADINESRSAEKLIAALNGLLSKTPPDINSRKCLDDTQRFRSQNADCTALINKDSNS